MNAARWFLAVIGLVGGWTAGALRDTAEPPERPPAQSVPRDVTAGAGGATGAADSTASPGGTKPIDAPNSLGKLRAAGRDATAERAAATGAAETPDVATAATEQGEPGDIAFVDLNYVLQNYPPFKDALVRLKSEIAEAEASLESRKREIDGMTEQLKILVAGTPQHDRLTREIVTAQAELAGRLQAEKAAFQRREAILYLDAYQQVVRQTESLARRRGLKAVMRLISPEVNASNPQSILEHINRPLVWHDPQRDITRELLAELIASAKPAATIDEVPEVPETSEARPSPRAP